MKNISVILPCRNEEKALDLCITSIKEVFKKNNLDGEIIVSDSSTDKSPEIARRHGVILAKHDKDGYGIAYLEGFKVAHGKYLFLADADGTYDFEEIPKFIKILEEGNDFVIGNRFNKKLNRNLMPWSHYYIGNPILSFILRVLFRTQVRDAHCGMRAIKKESLDQLNLQTTGMEFASEMIIKAVKNNLKIKEVDIEYKERKGESKLNTLSDGWRHLRFMFLYSPLFLFFIPGLILFLLGVSSMIYFYFSSSDVFDVQLFFPLIFLSLLLILLGYQIIIFSLFAKIYAINHLEDHNKTIEKLYKHITLEKALIVGSIFGLFGLLLFGTIFFQWTSDGLKEIQEIKNLVVALTFTVLGTQTAFSGFMLSILGIKDK